MRIGKLNKLSKVLANTSRAIKENPKLYPVMEENLTDLAAVVDAGIQEATMNADKKSNHKSKTKKWKK